MATTDRHQYCLICDGIIPLSRRRRHWNAITCGGACQTENRKRVHRVHSRRGLRRRRAAEARSPNVSL